MGDTDMQRIAAGQYLHRKTRCMVVHRQQLGCWQVYRPDNVSAGTFATKALAVAMLNALPPGELPAPHGAHATDTARLVILAQKLAEISPPTAGHVYRVVEVPEEWDG